MKKVFILVILALVANWTIAQNDQKIIAYDLIQKSAKEIGLNEKDMNQTIISDAYYDNLSGLNRVYLQQSYLDIPIYNQIQTLAFRSGSLVSTMGGRISSIEKKVTPNNGTPLITALDAVKAALKDRKIKFNGNPEVLTSSQNGHFITFDPMNVSRENITAQLLWVPTEEGKKVKLAWQVYIIQKTSSDYWLVRVDATNGTTINVSNLTVYCNWDINNPLPHPNHESENPNRFDFFKSCVQSLQKTETAQFNAPSLINSASYRVIPYPAESPSHPGGDHALVTNPWEAAPGNATSLKWHNNGSNDFNISRGNNVWAQEDRDGNNGTGTPANSSSATEPLIFDFTPNYNFTPIQTIPNPNQQFAITNLFYWNNVIHDLSYQYGFDEVSGNFQASNQGRGGQGNDFVLADAQDGSGTNNANFATPSDGGNGRMQMYLWNGAPQKDGDLDNGVVSHEFAHGISNRLTGGPAQAGCLQNAEQMGEGWSDYFSLMYTQNWATANLNTGFSTPRGIGTYLSGQTPTGAGIRTQRYCTNFQINNRVFGANISAQVHTRGEIWCATLWDMTWNIINQVGSINPNLYDPQNAGGNSIALRLVMEGMKLQPCSPGFIDARNAILRADEILYNGAHKCSIWEAFRRRGMGAFATQGSSDNVSDQAADYTLGTATVLLTQSVREIPEGQEVTYTNIVKTDNCAGITNFLLTDTLPTNVTYVSGGTYNAANRVVSFPVTMTAGQTNTYPFTVRINTGSYFPTVDLFSDLANGPNTSPTWTAATSASGGWTVSNTRSFSPTSSYYSSNPDIEANITLTLTNSIALGGTPPPLSFRHWFNTESTYDGGVLEVSINNGITWTDLQSNMLVGGYNTNMDATTLLSGRRAWSGSSNEQFIRTKVNMASYANQNVKIRFRYTTDVGTNLEGWYVDDIRFRDQALVEMQSQLFNSNNVRVAVSDTFTIILAQNTCIPASISTEPSNSNVCAGSAATFGVAAVGTSNQFQWQVSTNGGTTFSNIPGATTSTLTINAATVSQNNYRYRLIVSNACPSSDTSVAAILTVSNPSTIGTQPLPQTICSGSNANFSITTTGGTPSSYQWQVSNDGGVTFTDLAGQNTSSLALNNVAVSLNNNRYRVQVFSCATNPAVSQSALLTVNESATIATQPSDASSCVGNNVSFNVTASGSSITYQWQISINGGVSYTNITGQTGSTLQVSNLTLAQNNNKYRVIVTSAVCPGPITSAAATLTISNTPSILTEPAGTTVCVGSNASFNVAATGSGLTYQWQISTDGGNNYSNINGETNATLNLNAVTGSLSGNLYRVLIGSNCGAGNINSSAAILTVSPQTSISNQPADVTVCTQGNAQFSIAASGDALTYQWQISTDGGNTYSNISGENATALSLSNVTSSMNNNKYRVTIQSAYCGSSTSNAGTLRVSQPASISNQPQDITVCSGTDATFSVTASGSNLSYQWSESTDGGSNFNAIAGATGNTYTFTAGSVDDNNQYRVTITEAACGAVVSSVAVINVNPTPVVTITASPSTVILPGQTVQLNASATPASTSFSWFKNGGPIAGQSGSSINISANGAGTYTASVTDANNCTGSSNAINIRDSVPSNAFIYPNPNKGEFKITVPSTVPNSNVNVTLYDAKGSRVYVKGFAFVTGAVLQINIKTLSSGIYAVVLTDQDGNIIRTGKVLID
jgi:uncharacterized repeat protein (TIGR01451 family)